DSKMSESSASTYYSSWIFAAVHVACMIKSYEVNELADLFQIRAEIISRTLAALKNMGLVTTKAGRSYATNKSVHLPAEHPMSAVSHAAWRSYTIHSLQQNAEAGLHYSAVHCLSKTDVERLRRKLKATIMECRSTIEESPSETLAVFCLDWYSIS